MYRKYNVLRAQLRVQELEIRKSTSVAKVEGYNDTLDRLADIAGIL
jgi:hypothetical protein